MKKYILLCLLFLNISCIKDDAIPYPVQFEKYEVLNSYTEVKFTFSKVIAKRFENDLSIYYVNNDINSFLNNYYNQEKKYKVKKAIVDGRNLTLVMEKPLEKNKTYFFRFKYLYAEDGGEYPYTEDVEVEIKD